MQTTLIQRYLGNKSAISSEIAAIVREIALPGDLVCDAFSGSLAVSVKLRAAGFEVACNDINHFSWTFARAYFSQDGLATSFCDVRGAGVEVLKYWKDELQKLCDEDMSDVPRNFIRNDIFDHYCSEGPNSAFVSMRGTRGRRQFFTESNARSIDRALSRIRFRYHSGCLGERERCILTAILISAVEKISNTQGTYHDFPRTFLDSRALKPLTLQMPNADVFKGIPSRFIGKAEDSLDFVRKLPFHKVLYIDPPYNFRQYTSYYFMLNILSSYADIDDLDEYFSEIQYVRGQNMKDDFKSTFCNREQFVPSLRTLIERSKSEYVIMSYFDGRNHWGQFKTVQAEKRGKHVLNELFSSDLFVKDSYRCVPIRRKNYQSYGGYLAKPIHEFLFVAERSNVASI